jgi:hypothetical protein
MGAASKLWLHHALTALNASVNNSLAYYKGGAVEILLRLVDTR